MIAARLDLNALMALIDDFESEFGIAPMRYMSIEDRVKNLIDTALEATVGELEDEVEELRLENKELQSKVDDMEENEDCDCNDDISELEAANERLQERIDDLEELLGGSDEFQAA